MNLVSAVKGSWKTTLGGVIVAGLGLAICLLIPACVLVCYQ